VDGTVNIPLLAEAALNDKFATATTSPNVIFLSSIDNVLVLRVVVIPFTNKLEDMTKSPDTVKLDAVASPIFGVTKTALLENTHLPVPVSSEITEAN
jgi:hypothetical protein